MRLINAFELKQRILEERDKIPLTLPGSVYEFGIEKPNHYGNAMRGGIRKALRCMEQCYNYTLADTVNQTQHWIPVSERLPEEKKDVLLYFGFKGKNQAVGFWYGGDEDITFWYAYTDDGFYTDCDYRPTHWMPLPKPPKEV